jgi:predicted TIM-barrel fold metal-dependent hydrolase
MMFVSLLLPRPGFSQDRQDSDDPVNPLPLTEFQPRTMLRNIRTTPLASAKYGVIDIHGHFGFRFRGSQEKLDEYVEVMNRQNIAVSVSLDAKLGSTLQEHRQFLFEKHRDRFALFVHLDFQGSGQAEDPASWDCHRPDFARRMAIMLGQARTQGVCGVKFFKQFGLGYKNPDGSLIQIDDVRWDPIWQACGDLGLPVIIHTGDPAAFFQPIDAFNERYEELSRHPDWSFYGDSFPSREELLQARNRVIARHPTTKFIGAHMAGNPEDLQTVGTWLDQYPNLFVEPASRIGELGRQPYTSRDFLIRYQDRVLFGTDGPWPEPRLTYYWRFFETRDEYFPYSEKTPPPQGLWQIYGVDLPDEVLRKIYFENACRLIPELQSKYTNWRDARLQQADQ